MWQQLKTVPHAISLTWRLLLVSLPVISFSHSLLLSQFTVLHHGKKRRKACVHGRTPVREREENFASHQANQRRWKLQSRLIRNSMEYSQISTMIYTSIRNKAATAENDFCLLTATVYKLTRS